MIRRLGVTLALVLAESSAYADGPIVVQADVGVTGQLDDDDDDAGSSYYHPGRAGPAFNLDIAYRLIDQLAAGVHFGVRRYSWEGGYGNIPGAGEMFTGVDMPLELGVAAQWSLHRLWAVAWLGVEDSERQARGVAYALGVGVDLYVDPSGHRVGAYLDFTNVHGDQDSDHHLSTGIAYRYW